MQYPIATTQVTNWLSATLSRNAPWYTVTIMVKDDETGRFSSWFLIPCIAFSVNNQKKKKNDIVLKRNSWRRHTRYDLENVWGKIRGLKCHWVYYGSFTSPISDYVMKWHHVMFFHKNRLLLIVVKALTDEHRCVSKTGKAYLFSVSYWDGQGKTFANYKPHWSPRLVSFRTRAI